MDGSTDSPGSFLEMLLQRKNGAREVDNQNLFAFYFENLPFRLDFIDSIQGTRGCRYGVIFLLSILDSRILILCDCGELVSKTKASTQDFCQVHNTFSNLSQTLGL